MMQVIQGGRMSGKTHTIVTLVKSDPDAIMLVFNAIERERIIKTYNVKPGQVKVFSPRQATELGQRRRGTLYIDNLDQCLAMMFHQIPTAVTVSA